MQGKKQRSEFQQKSHLGLNWRKKEHRYHDEEVSSSGSDISIFGKFTRPVGSYRRGYRKPDQD